MATISLPFPPSSNTSYLLLEPAMPRFAGCCFLLLLLVSGLDLAYSESQCELVFEYFPYCLEFLTGNYYKPSRRCCGHIYKLNRLANRGLGAQLICWCIEYMVRGTEPRMMADRISELPTECQTHLSFPISEWMDCNS
ncbi:NON-SPECIFIC LIPID-TRANSFER PROTEIN 13 [Salix purpurea]|uniref:NON-SPECIFIC LIPID-TRANSFER PROTEIN 13 n=1 Tax=Salix purpurea TaxID=77065 RepID=A0A9Q0ZGY9_SALPP|nr:NON-SPECIFIC LIPID-TRANSFER PROTEIN 13 [Salix purpurea]